MNDWFVDYYDFFGITPDCSMEELQNAYQRTLNHLQFVLSSPMYSQKEWERLRKQFQFAKDGYAVLSHPNLKKSYDRNYHKYIEEKKKEKERGIDLRLWGSIEKSDFHPKEKYLYTASPRKEKKIYWSDIGENVKDFVVYNKRALAAVLASGFVFSSVALALKNKNNPHYGYPPYRELEKVEEKIEEEEIIPKKIPDIKENEVIMMRHYTVQRGDNLNKLAYNANSSVPVLKSINHLKKDMIYIGDSFDIPYTVGREDLEFYTDTIKLIDTQSIDDILKAYHTDIDTLNRLNPGVIVRMGEDTIFLDDYLVVPKFISKTDLIEAQREKHFNNK